MKQPQYKFFKHSIITALVFSLGGISFASFAETAAVTSATPTTANASPAEDHAARKAHWEKSRTTHKQDRTQHRTEEFKKADTNHDGQLTLEEWLAFKPHHRHGFWQRLACGGHDCLEHRDGGGHKGFKLRFNTLDANHDGSISLSEAQVGAPDIAQHFNNIDRDHNGQISKDELHAYCKTQHEKSQS